MEIIISGASFNTGNLGVSALTVSSINLLKLQWPECKISIIGGRTFSLHKEQIGNKEILIECYPVRYSLNIFKKNHIVWIYVTILLSKILPLIISKDNNKTTCAIMNADLTCDITGGDSFSDIYGMKRLVMGYLLKRICQITGKPFIMLPQTYGPFNSERSKTLAKKVLQQADNIYSRDKEGLEVIEELIGKSDKTILCPDVAFTLELRECVLPKGFPAEAKHIIGLNISGLLFNGGYTGKNEFGLVCNYKELIKEIIDYFAALSEVHVMLVPHVVPKAFSVENDLDACQELYQSLSEQLKSKVFIAKPETDNFYDQCEIKYLIGKCSFFMGSRMHATIAAISQHVPTVGLAYSKKFIGVYETVGIEECVADLRKLNNQKVLESVKAIYSKRENIKQKLEHAIPQVKQQVYSIFDNINL